MLCTPSLSSRHKKLQRAARSMSFSKKMCFTLCAHCGIDFGEKTWYASENVNWNEHAVYTQSFILVRHEYCWNTRYVSDEIWIHDDYLDQPMGALRSEFMTIAWTKRWEFWDLNSWRLLGLTDGSFDIWIHHVKVCCQLGNNSFSIFIFIAYAFRQKRDCS